MLSCVKQLTEDDLPEPYETQKGSEAFNYDVSGAYTNDIGCNLVVYDIRFQKFFFPLNLWN